MKRHWEVDELIEHWTLLPDEEALLGNKTGCNRLGFAVLLKFFELETRFPKDKNDVPKPVVVYLAKLVGVPYEEYHNYDWQGRNIKYHRSQIRSFLGFKSATVEDTNQMTAWLVQQVLGQEQDAEQLVVLVQERFRSLHIEPPTTARIDRLIRSALRTYETNFFSNILQKLPSETLVQIDALLSTTDTIDSGGTTNNSDARQTFTFHNLKTDPGRVGLESVLTEVTKLQSLRQLALPSDLFTGVSPKILETYKQRVAAELPSNLRTHPPAIRYTLVAAFGHLRSQEITDGLIELLLQIVHRLGTKAETKVEKELLSDFKQVSGKTGLLFQLASAALDQPEGIVKDVLYPVVGEQTLIDLVKEFKSTGLAYRQKVYKVMRSSYSSYYRRMVPQLLASLEFRSNNDVHRPVIQALELLKKYADSSQRYYEAKDEVPIEGVLRSGWREILLERNADGLERINRINYEISVLQALRERLRCKEIWVVGANRYRNPDEDLPADFETKREVYYQALNKPTDVEEFITNLKLAMGQALESLDNTLPHNPKIKLLKKGNGWISLSPLDAQSEPTNLLRLKAELGWRWPTKTLVGYFEGNRLTY